MKESRAEEIGERVRQHVTRRLMPFLVLAYLVAFIDRANVGVAKLQMQGELGFTDEVIGFGAGIFFVGYFLLEIPGSLIVERFSARKWFARIMITWGVMAALTGLIGLDGNVDVSTQRQFYVARFLLGAAEAGFFPGVIVYLSHWYRAEDRTRAKAWFMMTQPLAIVIGTPLARWILETVHWNGLPGWRWVFVLGGLPAIVLGVVALLYLTDRPNDAHWLCQEEREWLAGELQRESSEKKAAGQVRVIQALRNPQTLILVAVFFLIVTGNQAMLFFIPSITEKLRTLPVAARTAIATAPYLCSIAGILLNGYSSTRFQERRWHLALPILMTSATLGCMALASGHVVILVVLLCLLGFSFQAYLPVFWTLPTILFGKSAAAVVIGTVNSVGNLGGFVGPFLFGRFSTVTGSYKTGLCVLAGCMLISGILATQIRVDQNSNRNAQKT
jgi:ACS family tartrate transporter-like MFS transporter